MGFFLICGIVGKHDRPRQAFFYFSLLAEALVNQLIKSLACAKMARNSRVPSERPVVRQQTYVGKALVVSLGAFRRSRSLSVVAQLFCSHEQGDRSLCGAFRRALMRSRKEVQLTTGMEATGTCSLAVIVGSSRGGSA